MKHFVPKFWPTIAIGCASLGLLACCFGSSQPESGAPAMKPQKLAAQQDGLERAIGASLPFLEREGRAWMEGRTRFQDGTGCVSCHQVPFALWSHREARRAGITAHEEPWEELASQATAHALAAGTGRPGIFGPMMLAEGAPSEAALASADVNEMLQQLIAQQERDGRWRARGQFPSQRRPIDETDAIITMWNLLAIPSDADGEVERSRDRALAWLTEVLGESTEWRVARMLLAGRAGDVDLSESLRSDFHQRQNEDGGWGFLAGDPSDAMTTGQVLYGLALSSEDGGDAVTRGVSYLLAGQGAEGSWTVPSRTFTQEPTAAHDYVYDVWGTAWAAIGLSRVRHSVQPW